MGGLLPAPGSLSSALRSRYRSNWPQWRPAPASHPARPARARRYWPLAPPVRQRANPISPSLPGGGRLPNVHWSRHLPFLNSALLLAARPAVAGLLFLPAYLRAPPPSSDWPPPLRGPRLPALRARRGQRARPRGAAGVGAGAVRHAPSRCPSQRRAAANRAVPPERSAREPRGQLSRGGTAPEELLSLHFLKANASN